MGGEDFRSKPLKDDTYTYYVFDNLRCNQDHAGGDIFRYDTVEEAIAAFKAVQDQHPDWTVALGGSIGGVQEIDYIQRRGGDNCLITDYQKLDAFKDSPVARKTTTARRGSAQRPMIRSGSPPPCCQAYLALLCQRVVLREQVKAVLVHAKEP